MNQTSSYGLAANDTLRLHYAEDAAMQDISNARISIVPYSAQEVISHFSGLYNAIDWSAKVAELNIATFQIYRRQKALREFKAISIALWGLALQKSFPNNADEFFAQFIDLATFLSKKNKDTVRLRASIDSYVLLLAEKKDSDFLPVADHLARELAIKAKDLPWFRVKVSLLTRNLYTLIFNNLV